MSCARRMRPTPFRQPIPLLLTSIVLVSLSILLSRVVASSQTIVSHAGSSSHNLVFSAWQDGNWDIFRMDADGSHLTNLTNTPTHEVSPLWSPQGDRIAYISDFDGYWKNYTMDADGSHIVNWSPNPLDFFGVVWSPDGTRLLNNLVSQPDWSPDGRIFAYEGVGGLYLTDVNRNLTVRFTDHSWFAFGDQLKWSPDGRYIAVVALGSELQNALYLLDYEALTLVQLGESDLQVEESPTWSADSQRIAFVAARNSTTDIHSIRVDNTGLTNLTHSEQNESTPQWSPDGQLIIFNRFIGEDWQIFVMNADGSGVKQLTSGAYDHMSPGWQP